MSDRVHFTNEGTLTTEMLNDAFDFAEEGEQRVVAGVGVAGVIGGLNAILPTKDFTLGLTPGLVFDGTGRRIHVPSEVVVDCSRDFDGQPTSVIGPRGERWVSVFVSFARRESDPILDRFGRTVARRLLESYAITVRQGAEADAGTASRPQPEEGEVLICDIHRVYGRWIIEPLDVDTSRRIAPQLWKAGNIAVQQDDWQVVEAASTVQQSLKNVDQAIVDSSDAKKVRVDASAWGRTTPVTNAHEAFASVDEALEHHRLLLETVQDDLNTLLMALHDVWSTSGQRKTLRKLHMVSANVPVPRLLPRETRIVDCMMPSLRGSDIVLAAYLGYGYFSKYDMVVLGWFDGKAVLRLTNPHDGEQVREDVAVPITLIVSEDPKVPIKLPPYRPAGPEKTPWPPR